MSLTLEESAARSGAHCWVEQRLFEVLGALVPVVGSPEAKLLLDRHSLHAAWRARQWWDRLPVTDGIDRAGLVAPPDPWRRLLAAAPVVTDPADGGPRPDDAAPVAVVYRAVLPRLAVAYRVHLAATSAPADGPVIRTLHQVAHDVGADWLEGEAVVQGLLVDSAAVTAAAAAVSRAEATFLG